MTVDINLLLRAWSFDMDSEVLGELRFSNANPVEMLGGDEEEIRAGSIVGYDLARRIFLGMAHKRTGVDAIDTKCEGPNFTEAEVATVPPGELDAFCDQLISGRLRAERDPSASGNEAQTVGGAEALPGALLAVVDSDRAARTRLAATMKKQMATHEKQHSQMAADIARAAVGTSAIVNAREDILRHQRLVDDAMGIIGGTGTAKIISDMQERDDIVKRAALHVANGGVLQAMEEAARGGVLKGAIDSRKILGLDDWTLAQRVAAANERATFDIAGALAERLPTVAWPTAIEPVVFRPIDIPPNPAHKTNEILEEVLEHRRELAAKADVLRAQEKVEAAAASDVSNKMAKSGLLFTKLSFWVTLVAFVVPSICGVWVYYEQKEAANVAKAEADENSKQAAIEIAKQHAEIRELSASLSRLIQPKPDTAKPAKK